MHDHRSLMRQIWSSIKYQWVQYFITTPSSQIQVNFTRCFHTKALDMTSEKTWMNEKLSIFLDKLRETIQIFQSRQAYRLHSFDQSLGFSWKKSKGATLFEERVIFLKSSFLLKDAVQFYVKSILDEKVLKKRWCIYSIRRSRSMIFELPNSILGLQWLRSY